RERLAGACHRIARLEAGGILVDLCDEIVCTEFDDFAEQRTRTDGHRLVHVKHVLGSGAQYRAADPAYAPLAHRRLPARAHSRYCARNSDSISARDASSPATVASR